MSDKRFKPFKIPPNRKNRSYSEQTLHASPSGSNQAFRTESLPQWAHKQRLPDHRSNHQSAFVPVLPSNLSGPPIEESPKNCNWSTYPCVTCDQSLLDAADEPIRSGRHRLPVKFMPVRPKPTHQSPMTDSFDRMTVLYNGSEMTKNVTPYGSLGISSVGSLEENQALPPSLLTKMPFVGTQTGLDQLRRVTQYGSPTCPQEQQLPVNSRPPPLSLVHEPSVIDKLLAEMHAGFYPPWYISAASSSEPRPQEYERQLSSNMQHPQQNIEPQISVQHQIAGTSTETGLSNIDKRLAELRGGFNLSSNIVTPPQQAVRERSLSPQIQYYRPPSMYKEIQIPFDDQVIEIEDKSDGSSKATPTSMSFTRAQQDRALPLKKQHRLAVFSDMEHQVEKRSGENRARPSTPLLLSPPPSSSPVVMQQVPSDIFPGHNTSGPSYPQQIYTPCNTSETVLTTGMIVTGTRTSLSDEVRPNYKIIPTVTNSLNVEDSLPLFLVIPEKAPLPRNIADTTLLNHVNVTQARMEHSNKDRSVAGVNCYSAVSDNNETPY